MSELVFKPSHLSTHELGHNPVFLHFFGLRRSGNHALIHWLSEGLSGDGEHSVMFVNNVAEDASYSSTRERRPDYIQGQITRLHPDFVILSYEDLAVGNRHDLKHRQRFSNDRDKDLVVLRSLPNLMASQIKRRHDITEQSLLKLPILRLGLTAVRDLWVENAQSILNSDDIGLTGVLYDRWFTDRVYRDEIANLVGFTNLDVGLNDVVVPDTPTAGSSFDGTTFQGRAQEMQVLERRQLFTEDENSRDLYFSLVTPEVIALNQELFGFDPSIAA